MASMNFFLRTCGYKIGLGLLLIGTLVFCIGFATPFWTSFSYSDSTGTLLMYNGLWLSCIDYNGVKLTCVSSILANNPGWYKAVQALQALAIIFCIINIIYAAVINFLTKRCYFNRIVEASAFCTVVTGLIGITIYGAELHQVKNDVEDLKKILEKTYEVDVNIFHEHVNWSFGVDVAGLGTILFAAIFIAVYNRPIPEEDATVVYHCIGDGGNVTSGDAYSYVVSNGTPVSYVQPGGYVIPYPAYTAPPPSYSSVPPHQATAPSAPGQQGTYGGQQG